LHGQAILDRLISSVCIDIAAIPLFGGEGEVFERMDSTQVLKVDVHHHSFPPAYTEYLVKASQKPAGWVTEPWSLPVACDYCKSKNIGFAVLSCIPGGPHSDVDLQQARDFTKSCNEYNSKVARESRNTLGFFAHITNMCEVEVTLEEIDYAFDTLGAAGIALGTSYHKSGRLHYLGDTEFVPVWDALSARSAVVFVHPVPSPNMDLINQNLPPPAYDFPHETGRTAIDMITNTSNMLRDHATNCSIILSHAGGDLPYLIDRVAGLMCHGPEALRLKKTSDDVLSEARRFYYDTALSSSPMQLNAVVSLLGPDKLDHILFGTDFPPAGAAAIEYFSRQLRGTKVVDFADLGHNALKLFPQLQRK